MKLPSLLTLLFATLLVLSPAFGADKRPNFILCMADDQGFGDVGYNSDGALKTPVLDEMARTGLKFERFYAAAPVCSPTRGSVMTGRHPNRFGCFQWGYTLRPQEVTIAEALKAAGYTTGHFGKWHLGSVRADSPVSPGNSGFDVWVSSPNYFDNDPYLSHGGKVVKHEGESSMVAMEQAVEFIRKASKGDKPFLAVIWFGSPHNPHAGSTELMELYEDLSPREAAYAAEITGIDRAMGRLRKELHDLNIADTTLVWYTSDNGPQGGGRDVVGSAGPFSGRKGDLLEGGIRVPAIIEWPAVITSPRATDVAAGTIDIYPTLLDIAGVKNEAIRGRPMDGLSIRPLIEGKPFTRNKPMGFWDFPERGIRSPSTELLVEQLEGKPSEYPDVAVATTIKPYPPEFRDGEVAWIDGDWKLLRRPASAPGKGKKAKNAGTRDRVALYNLKDDPAEKHDLSAKEPERVKQMTKALDQWQASVIHSLNGGDY